MRQIIQIAVEWIVILVIIFISLYMIFSMLTSC